MIDLTPTTTVSTTGQYINTARLFSAITTEDSFTDNCCFSTCRIPIPVYSDSESENTRYNDRTRFLFTYPNSHIVTFTMTNIDTGVDYEITDETYGDYANENISGTFRKVFSFVVDWRKVSNNISFGNYKFNTVITSNGNEVNNYMSPCYYLSKYSCEGVGKTIRLEARNKGYNGSGIDWRELEFLSGVHKTDQIRLYGSVKKSPITTTDYTSDTQRANLQIQTSIHHEYELLTHIVSENEYKHLVRGILLENPIKLSVYDKFNDTDYYDLKTSYLDVSIEEFDNAKDSKVTIKLEDYKKDNIKRH